MTAMRKTLRARWISVVLFGGLGAAMVAIAADNASDQTPNGASDETPIGKRWWPSEWGPDDQRGAANRITPEKILEATQLIREGKLYQLGRIYESDMPLYGKRHFSLIIPGLPTGGPFGDSQLVYNDELFSGEIGQIGTQFDGLGHIGCRVDGEDIFYNGFKLSEFGDSYGLKKLGVEQVGSFFTRGILIDVAGLRNTERLPIGYAISPEEIQRCLRQQNLQIRPGDVVLIHTGHGKLWKKDNEQYNEGHAGIGMAAAKYLTDRKVCLIGADTWSIEVVPSENEDVPFPVHNWNITRHGIYHLENLDLEQLAADGVYEFAFVFSPLRLKGATGSPGNPIAVN